MTLKTPGGRDIAPARPAHHDFRPDINGLRALAVLGVVAFHAQHNWLPGGFAGVDVFFVISGFLITRIILSEREAQKFSLAAFYAKRAKRILPALLLVTFSVYGLGWLWADPHRFRVIAGHIEASSFFTVNLTLLRESASGGYFASDSNAIPLLHLWSLAIEEQFYLFWPALMLAASLLGRRFIGPTIAVIAALSLAFGLYETPRDPTAAFYLPWGRAWELALGGLLAWREVFVLHRAPHPPKPWSEIGAGLGVALILAGYFYLDESQSFPGWRALIPALGCALVIAHPGSTLAATVLGNRVAQFFGKISYPLYLWHWPLFAYAHIHPGLDLGPKTMLALSALATLLAYVTTVAIEQPIDRLFRRRPALVAISLVVVLALSGLLGRETRIADGFVQRFSPQVVEIFNISRNGADVPRLLDCFYQNDKTLRPIEEERERAAAFFAKNACDTPKDAKKPTILIVGDSHAAHLFVGFEKIYGERANVLTLTATYCMPLIENVPTNQGAGGTKRCAAINRLVFEKIRKIRPDVLVVGSYFSSYLNDRAWAYPDYLNDFARNVRRLQADGVQKIVIAGQVPTWTPFMPTAIGLEVDAGQTPAEFSAEGVRPESLETDAILRAMDWGPGAIYVSQAQKLCREQKCRRLVGPKLPDDMLAVDYGHYSFNGSIFAVENFLQPVIDPLLAEAQKR